MCLYMLKRIDYLLYANIKVAYINKWRYIYLPLYLSYTNKQFLQILKSYGILTGYSKTPRGYRFRINHSQYKLPKKSFKLFRKTQRIYISIYVLRNYYGSLPKHIYILQTRYGIITSITALKYNVGGYAIGVVY